MPVHPSFSEQDPSMPTPEQHSKVIDDFMTMESGSTSALIIKAPAGATPPVAARWLPTALELEFPDGARSMVFVPAKFRPKWVDRVIVALFGGAGDIDVGGLSVDSMVPVPILA